MKMAMKFSPDFLYSGLHNFTISGQYMLSEQYKERETAHLSQGIKKRIKPQLFLDLYQTELHTRSRFYFDFTERELDADLRFLSYIRHWDLELQLDFNDVTESFKVNTYHGIAGYNFTNRHRLYTEFRIAPQRSTIMKVGFNGESTYLDYDISAGYRKPDSYFFGLTWSIKMIPAASGYQLADQYEYSRGIIDVLAFVDTNQNNVKDDDEAPLHHVSFRLSQREQKFYTDETGHATVTGIIDNEPTTLIIDSLNENVGYIPRYLKRVFRGRATYMGKLLFPFDPIIYISGEISLTQKRLTGQSLYRAC